MKRLIERIRRARESIATGGAVALIVGLVSELAGIDIAPSEVDVIVTGIAALAALVGRWRAARDG